MESKAGKKMTSAPSWSQTQHGLTGTGEMQLPGAHVPGQGLMQRKNIGFKISDKEEI